MSVRVIAIGDCDGQVWTPTGGDLPEEVSQWSPGVMVKSSQPGETRAVLLAFAADDFAADDLDDVSIAIRMRDSKGNAYTSPPDSLRPNADSGVRYYEFFGRFDPAVTSSTMEVTIGSGEWEELEAAPFGKNYGSSTGFRDGGRRGRLILQSTSSQTGRSGRVAAVALSLLDDEPMNDDYRFHAVDKEGDVVAKASIARPGGRVGLFVVEVDESVAERADRFVLEQRPRVSDFVEGIPLQRSAARAAQ